MNFSIKFDTVQSGWPIVYIEGPQAIIFKAVVFLSLKLDFGPANCADLHCKSTHLGGLQSTKG